MEYVDSWQLLSWRRHLNYSVTLADERWMYLQLPIYHRPTSYNSGLAGLRKLSFWNFTILVFSGKFEFWIRIFLKILFLGGVPVPSCPRTSDSEDSRCMEGPLGVLSRLWTLPSMLVYRPLKDVEVTAIAKLVQPSIKQKSDLLRVVTNYSWSIITRHKAIAKAYLCCVVEYWRGSANVRWRYLEHSKDPKLCPKMDMMRHNFCFKMQLH